MSGLVALAESLVPHLKVAHIGFLCVWVAGLLALPRMLARHDPAIGQADFTRIRHASHYAYVWAITPAAVLAIASGATLIFAREVFTAWMFAKLVLVGGLVALHAWVGHTLVRVAETEGRHDPPEPLWPLLALCALVLGILVLVLAKPELGEVPLPSWLTQPVGGQLPFDVPRR